MCPALDQSSASLNASMNTTMIHRGTRCITVQYHCICGIITAQYNGIRGIITVQYHGITGIMRAQYNASQVIISFILETLFY